MQYQDLVFSIIWFFLILILVYALTSFWKRAYQKKWLMIGMVVKIWGGVAFLFVYTFYFNKIGDTFAYLNIGRELYRILLDNPSVFFEVLSPNSPSKSVEFYSFIKSIDFYVEWDTYMVILFTSLISFFSFGYPFTTTIIFSAVSFVGLWHIYKLLIKLYPEQQKAALISTLFIPSVVFWGSGVLKDTLVMGFFGILIHAFFMIFKFKQVTFFNLLKLCISAFIISVIKPYVSISLIPGIVLWFSYDHITRVENVAVRLIIFPILLSGAAVAGLYGIVKIGEYFPQYSTDRLIETASSYQYHHYAGGDRSAEGAGSGYSLGEYDPTFSGIISKVPAAINVTLYRPYLWEIRNPGMLISAVESAIFLIMTVIIIIKMGPLRTVQAVRGDPFLLFCMLFALFFAFSIGFTSYNFGALARYKIPCLPFFAFVLLYMFEIARKEKKKRKLSILRK